MKSPPMARRLEIGLAIAALTATAAALILLPNPKGLMLPLSFLAVPLAVLLWFDRPIQVLAVILVFMVNLDYFKLGYGLSLDVVTSVLLMVLLAMRLGVRPNPSIEPLIERWMVLFLLALGLSMLVSVDLGQSVKRFGREVEYIVLFAFLARYPFTRSQLRTLVSAVVLAAVLPSVLGALGYVFGIRAFLGQELYLDSLYLGEPRAQATLSHPVTLAVFLALTLPLTLVLFYRKVWLPRRVTLPLALLQVLALYVSYGRTGWAGFAASCVVLLVLWRKKRFLLCGVPPLLVAAWKLIPTLQERMAPVVSEGPDNSLLWRIGLWTHALAMVPQKPFLGSGFGTFLDYVHYQKGFGPHQTWIGLLVETGIVGLLAFLILLLGTGWLLLSRYRQALGTGRYLLEAALAIWVSLFVASWGANVFGLPSIVVYFWVVVALALQGNHLWREQA